MLEIIETVQGILVYAFLFLGVPGGLLISLFSQTVHRKYRKNKELAPAMGATSSGFLDVLFFSGMFGWPLVVTRWMYRRHPFPIIPDPDVLMPHATRYDRVVGFLAYWLFHSAGFCTLLIVVGELIKYLFFDYSL